MTTEHTQATAQDSPIFHAPANPYASPYPEPPIPDQSLFDFLFGELTDANKIAIADAGSQVTYQQLRDMIEAFAGALADRGIGKGDVVALHCPNSTTFAVAFHGILRANATVTTVATLATTEDIEKQLKIAGAKAILTTSSVGWAGHNAGENVGLAPEHIIGLTGINGMGAMLAEQHQPPAQSVDPRNDVAVIPFSSGTTGVPKGVMLSHRNLIANVVQIEQIAAHLINRDTVAITPLPFFHIYGMNVSLNWLLKVRSTQYTMPQFDLVAFMELIQDQKADFAFIAPPIGVALAKHPLVDNFDLSSLRTILSGAASMQDSVVHQLEKRLGCNVTQGYGMTEMSPVSHLRVDTDAPSATIGYAIPHTEFALIDPQTGDEIPVPASADTDSNDEHASNRSASGELWVRGPQVMLGYLNNKEATDEVFVDDWMRTGDIAEFDTEGYVYIVDRLKELIKYKGYQVAPAELEALLLSHPGIADVACVSGWTDAGEEVPKAFVVRAESHPELAADDVMAYAADRVAPYKKIRMVEFIDAIPKSATGKILRKNLIKK